MEKIWSKSKSTLNDIIESYTVGGDNILDERIFYKYDLKASAAHIEALAEQGIFTRREYDVLLEMLSYIEHDWDMGVLHVTSSDEDCHTVIERELTRRAGSLGKKVHTARSRNDQSLTMIRLFMMDSLKQSEKRIEQLINSLSKIEKKHKKTPFIGYSHTQQAMPTTYGHYINSFREQLEDDLSYTEIIRKFISKNPLGSGSGFGSNIDINRSLTAKRLGFNSIQKNSLYCQNSRGKFELKYVHSLSQIMQTLQKIATDVVLYTTREFSILKADDSITTGSSMMPQKKNLDVAELIRANYAMIIGLETQISSLVHGLTSGYNRDFQLIKKSIVEAHNIVHSSLEATLVMMENVKPNKKRILEVIERDIYSTDVVNIKVKETGQSFRDVYKNIMDDGNFDVNFDEIISQRKSLGSPGNY